MSILTNTYVFLMKTANKVFVNNNDAPTYLLSNNKNYAYIWADKNRRNCVILLYLQKIEIFVKKKFYQKLSQNNYFFIVRKFNLIKKYATICLYFTELELIKKCFIFKIPYFSTNIHFNSLS